MLKRRITTLYGYKFAHYGGAFACDFCLHKIFAFDMYCMIFYIDGLRKRRGGGNWDLGQGSMYVMDQGAALKGPCVVQKCKVERCKHDRLEDLSIESPLKNWLPS